MTFHVSDILANICAKKERVSAVDIVMGDHWGELNLGNSMRLSLLGLMLRQQQQLGGQTGCVGSPALRQNAFQIVRRGPQAMVKVIRNGGTTNARGMRDQMSYLEKDGDAKLERSEQFFGIELDEDAQEGLIEAWGLDRASNTDSDKTTHFVVSFPSDTEHGAAYRAGRSWAYEMFASGTYGDVFDYYTAFHTDRAHPHIHVIVNRRGVENGDWLKVSRRSQINYDELRAVQVEVAAREDIYLEASPRLARGLSDRPIPDAEIRCAERENRIAISPAHTPITAIRAAATIALHSEHYLANAELLKTEHPELSNAMKSVGTSILIGQEILPHSDPSRPILTLKEVEKQREFIMSRRSEILQGIETIDAELSTIPKGPDRADLERDADRIKADASKLMPDVQELRHHLLTNSRGYYQGIDANDAIELSIKERADNDIGELAGSIGIDPAKLISRFEGAQAASQALADRWRKDELEDIQKNLFYQDRSQQGEAEQLAQTAYDDLHRNALQTYRKAERDLEAHAARKKELYRIVKLIKEGRNLDTDFDEPFHKTIKDTLHPSELRQLENGNTEVFKHVTKDVDSQRLLSRRYLEAELDEAEGTRKLQISTALTKIAHETRRDADLAAQEASKALERDRSRGMDR